MFCVEAAEYESGDQEVFHKPMAGVLVRTVHCPVCKQTDRMNSNLKEHMKAKRDVQCKDCMLYFSNCNSLSVHMKGRCRKTK